MELTSSSESLEDSGSSSDAANFAGVVTDWTDCHADDWIAGEDELFPAIRASNFASFDGREGSEGFEELDDKCVTMSSVMADRIKKPQNFEEDQFE